jgi:hypothetical protein
MNSLQSIASDCKNCKNNELELVSKKEEQAHDQLGKAEAALFLLLPPFCTLLFLAPVPLVSRCKTG